MQILIRRLATLVLAGAVLGGAPPNAAHAGGLGATIRKGGSPEVT